MRTSSASSLRCLAAAALLGQLVAAGRSSGCDSQNATKVSTSDKDKTTSVNIGDRNYLLYVPIRYNSEEPAPLILSFHGAARDAEHQERLDQFNTTFFNKDYLVAYPNSVHAFWQGAPGATADDVGFTKNILSQIGKQYCVDTNRIFATGKSQGGGMAGLLAADSVLSTMIAAFAPVSGAFYVDDDASCKPATVSIPSAQGRPNIPILEFHGEADETIPYDGGADRGACLPAITHFMQSWAKLNGLNPDKNTTSKVKGATNNEATVFKFGEGSSAGMVTHIMVGKNIGHDW